MMKILLSLISLFCIALSANATTITLDETNNTHNFLPGSGVTPGNVWLCEPGSPLTATGCVVSDLAHFFTVAGVDKVIFISDQDPSPPPTFDDPADQLGFGGNVPAAGDVFLRELCFLCTTYAPGTGIGSGVDPTNRSPLDYQFVSNCSDNCGQVPEPPSLLLVSTGIITLVGFGWKRRKQSGWLKGSGTVMVCQR